MKKLFSLLLILVLLASCAPATPEVVEVIKTVVVEVEGETVVETIVVQVTPTPEPVEQVDAGEVLGLPRNETLIADILTGRVGTPDNFNDWVGWKNRDRGIQQLAFEPLWTIDFATGEIINSMATGDPEYNEDFTEMTVHLREGILWSDGQPFTSADVVFTVELLVENEGFNAHSLMAENVKSVSAPDDYTVVFELNVPNSRFHTTFLDRWGATYIMPKHIFEAVDDPVTFEFNPIVGTGPYKLHSYDPSGFWTIWEKREDWDKTPTGMLFGEPKIKYIVFQNFANEGTKILSQLTHQADVLNLSAEGLKAILSQSKTSRAYQPSYPWVVNNDPCITGITFNTAHAPYDNKEVRWALLLAIDIVEYTGIAVDGTGTLSPVHVPYLSNYPKDFIEPMVDWLADFTLDLGNGETFQPFDPEASKRMAEYAHSRGYVFPDDEEYIRQAFGIGWYKYAPEAAEKLLIKNGFSRDANGKWLLPDGTPWKITIISQSDVNHPGARNAVAAAQQWKKFGIETEALPTENQANLEFVGDFDVSSSWPATEPWGAGPDLYRVLNNYNSEYMKPLGETNNGHASRWSSAEMDAVIDNMRITNPADYQATVDVGIEGLKILVEEMPGIPTFGYIGFVAWDQQYWTNWPGSENPYSQPYTHWGPFKYMTTRLEPAR